jgi:hypothetical protein
MKRQPLNGVRTALEECQEYFSQRADAEYFTDSPSPVGNEEMRLLTEVEVGLELLKEVAARQLIERSETLG